MKQLIKIFPNLTNYQAARWYEVTAAHNGELGISFETPEGEQIRLRLSLDSARHCAGALIGVLLHDQTMAEYAAPFQKSMDNNEPVTPQ
jgi:hypothetical protein